MAVALVSECNAQINFYERLGFLPSPTPEGGDLEWTRPTEPVSSETRGQGTDDGSAALPGQTPQMRVLKRPITPGPEKEQPPKQQKRAW